MSRPSSHFSRGSFGFRAAGPRLWVAEASSEPPEEPGRLTGRCRLRGSARLSTRGHARPHDHVGPLVQRHVAGAVGVQRRDDLVVLRDCLDDLKDENRGLRAFMEAATKELVKLDKAAFERAIGIYAQATV